MEKIIIIMETIYLLLAVAAIICCYCTVIAPLACALCHMCKCPRKKDTPIAEQPAEPKGHPDSHLNSADLNKETRQSHFAQSSAGHHVDFRGPAPTVTS